MMQQQDARYGKRISTLAAQGLAIEAMWAQSRAAVVETQQEAVRLGLIDTEITLMEHTGTLVDYLKFRYREIPRDLPAQDATIPGVPEPARSTTGRDLGL